MRIGSSLAILAAASQSLAGPFPAELELSSLLLSNGGDGSAGFVLNGYEVAGDVGEVAVLVDDVNGDGLADIVVGNDVDCFVVFGRATDFPAELELESLTLAGGGDGTLGFVLRSDAEYQCLNVAGAGDVNDDGVADLITGSSNADVDGVDAVGRSIVIFGRQTAFPAELPLADILPENGGDGSQGFVMTGTAEFEFVGRIVNRAGDVNDDGIGDVIVTTTDADPGINDAGRAYVVFGRPVFPAEIELSSLFPQTGGDGTSGFVINGIRTRDAFGAGASPAGDVNADGIDDLVMGAQLADSDGLTDTGEGYLLFGRSDGFPALFQLADLLPENGGDGSLGVTLSGIQPAAMSGTDVAGAGDVNADGIDDVVIAAWEASPAGRILAGMTSVVFGRSDPFPATIQLSSLIGPNGGDGTEGFVARGINELDRSGSAVSGIGDLNGDGVSDFIATAFLADIGFALEIGENYVIYGRRTGFPSDIELSTLRVLGGGDGTEGFVLNGAEAGESSGRSTGGGRDVNGDGRSDLIIGANRADANGITDAGRAYVVYGRPATVGGAVAGLDTTFALCLNLDTAQSVPIPLQGDTIWDCETRGLAVAPGDEVRWIVAGRVTDGSVLEGVMTGLELGNLAICVNFTTGTSIIASLDPSGSWDCLAAGLDVSPDDLIFVNARGTAEFAGGSK